MHKQELHEALSQIHASGDLVKEVLSVDMENRKPASGWRIARRIAVCAAVLALLLTWLLWPGTEESYVTGPGLLVVRAYALDEDTNTPIEEVILEEGVEFTPIVKYWPEVSYREYYPLSFSVDKDLYPDMNITIEVNTDAGIFYKNEPYDPDSPIYAPETSPVEQVLLQYDGQHFTADIDKKLYWYPLGFDYEYLRKQFEQGNLEDFSSALKSHYFSKNPSFIDVIIWADNYIIGYCVMEIRELNGVTGSRAQNFSFEVLKIVSFPDVDGRWQNVTLKYVQEQINNIHAEREAKQ